MSEKMPLRESSLLLDAGVYRLRRCRTGYFLYQAHDRYIGCSLDLYGEYSEGEASLFRRIVHPGDVVIDAGANIGCHTVVFSQAVGEAGRVLAFEPQHEVFRLLRANVALNRATNVTCYEAALGSSAGEAFVPAVDYTAPGNFGGVALVYEKRAPEILSYPVSVLTVDALALPRCRFIKVDVEGSECQVLRGAAQTITRCRPMLYVENDRAEHATALVQCLVDLGYRFCWHRPLLYNPQNFYGASWNAFGEMTSLNLLCLPEEWSATPEQVLEGAEVE